MLRQKHQVTPTTILSPAARDGKRQIPRPLTHPQDLVNDQRQRTRPSAHDLAYQIKPSI